MRTDLYIYIEKEKEFIKLKENKKILDEEI